jgi:hypothetical protein
VKGFVPRFLCEQIVTLSKEDDSFDIVPSDADTDTDTDGDSEDEYAYAYDTDAYNEVWTEADLDALDDEWEKAEGLAPQMQLKAQSDGVGAVSVGVGVGVGVERKRPVILEWKGAATSESPVEDLLSRKKRSYDGDFDADAEIMNFATNAVDDGRMGGEDGMDGIMDVDALGMLQGQKTGVVQVDIPIDVQQIDWKALAKGRHSAKEKYTFGDDAKK